MGHTNFQMSRRAFIGAGVASAGALALGPKFFQQAFAGPATPGPGPYGPLGPFDGNGIALPDGFTSREIARGGSLVAPSGYLWHLATDGQATFPTLGRDGTPDGGWILTANSEVPLPGGGGVSGVEFSDEGRIERAYRVLSGTMTNCAGGPAPWGKWLSCEEHDNGRVHECDPTRLNTGVARPALGVFAHEAVCVDPIRERLYLTEDKGDGCLYRFTPSDYPDLSAGLLEVAVGAVPGTVTWAEVPNPAGGATSPTRYQVAGAAHFDGGEGTWYDDNVVYFTTKGDGRVWTLNTVTNAVDLLNDEAALGPDAPLSGVDNITVAPSGDVYVCEDGRDHDICVITPDLEVTRFLKLEPTMHAGPAQPHPFAGNETVGVVFNPDGKRMYFGAQRSFPTAGFLPSGVVYEITGPFRNLPQDLRAPRVRLRAPKRRRIPDLLKKGMPVTLELDERSGVKATLKIFVKGPNGKKRARVIASAQPSVAVRDRVKLKLRPSKRARRLLAAGDDRSARLKVVAKDAAGNTTVLRRTVRLVDPD